MMDPERDRIRAEAKAEADLHNRLATVEQEIKDMKVVQNWGIRGLIGAAVYLATQLWTFVSSGGVIK